MQVPDKLSVIGKTASNSKNQLAFPRHHDDSTIFFFAFSKKNKHRRTPRKPRMDPWKSRFYKAHLVKPFLKGLYLVVAHSSIHN